MLNCKISANSADNLYVKLLNGTLALNRFLCSNRKLRKHFDDHMNCYTSLHEDFIDCEGPDDWYEGTNHTAMCECMHTIMACNYQKTAQLCGLQAGHYLHALSREIFVSSMKDGCDASMNEPNIPESLVASKAERHILVNVGSILFVLVAWMFVDWL